MRINIDITGDSASKLSVLAADIETDRKNYMQNILERHAEKEYAKLLRREIKKLTNPEFSKKKLTKEDKH